MYFKEFDGHFLCLSLTEIHDTVCSLIVKKTWQNSIFGGNSVSSDMSSMH